MISGTRNFCQNMDPQPSQLSQTYFKKYKNNYGIILKEYFHIWESVNSICCFFDRDAHHLLEMCFRNIIFRNCLFWNVFLYTNLSIYFLKYFWWGWGKKNDKLSIKPFATYLIWISYRSKAWNGNLVIFLFSSKGPFWNF